MPTQGPSRDDGEIDFSAEELAEMQVDVAGREDSAQAPRKKRALRVPADEVPRRAAATELDIVAVDPGSKSDEAVEHAFSNGGRSTSVVTAPPKFMVDKAVPAPARRARQSAKTTPMPILPVPDEEPEISVTDEGGEREAVAKAVAKLPPNVRALMRAVVPSHERHEDVEQLDSAELVVADEHTDELPESATVVTRAAESTVPVAVSSEAPEAEETTQELTLDAAQGDEEDADEVIEADLAEEPVRKAPPAVPAIPERPRSVTPMMTPAVIVPATVPLQPPPPPPTPGANMQSLPEELRPRRRRRVKQWFEEIFDDDYLRTLPYLSARQTERESAFAAESLGLEAGATVLDVGCGYGRHAMELAGRGFQVTGIDLSLPLLIRAADAARRIGVAVNFVHGDMREMTFDQEFDGAYCLFTSFGYFDDDTNRKVAANLQRALKPGGRVLVELVNRDYITKDLPTRVWWQGEGCVVLEEVDFNYFSSRLQVQRSIIFEDGRQLEQEISIRAYSLHEIGKVLHHAGFRVIEVSGGLGLRGNFFGANSRQLLVLAEKKVG